MGGAGRPGGGGLCGSRSVRVNGWRVEWGVRKEVESRLSVCLGLGLLEQEGAVCQM